MEGESEGKKGTTYMQWIAALTANATLLIHGMQSSWISPTSKLLQSPESPSDRPLTDNEITWVASIIYLAACFGVPLFAYLVDKIGRKKSILIITVLQALSWIIIICSSIPISLIVGRCFAGLPTGACYNVVPMYVKEISQDNIRGILGSFIVLLQNIGILFMFAIGFYMNYYVVLYISACIPVITVVIMLFAPEAPAFLVKKGHVETLVEKKRRNKLHCGILIDWIISAYVSPNLYTLIWYYDLMKWADSVGHYGHNIEQAATTLATLRGLDSNDKIIQKEMDYMKNEENVYKSLPKVTFSEIWQNRAWRRGCYLNMALMTVRALSGIFALITFTPAILSSSGVTINAEIQAISFPAVMIVASIVSMSCVEKFGRKPIMIWTCVVATLSLCVLATTMLLQTYGNSPPKWIPAATIVIYMCAYAGGISPMPYIVMAEMFNFQIRAKVMGIFVTYACFLCFIQLVVFTAITNALGAHNVFFCYAAINLVGAIISVLFLMETKGKTVEEIEIDLKGQRK